MTTDMEAQVAQPMPFGEFIAHMRMRLAASARLWSAIVALSLAIAALLPPRFSATATLAVMPAPEFTVRQDAGSHSFNTSVLAMDQVMKAETEILHSEDLHAATLQSLGLLQVYPALDRSRAPWTLRVARAVLRVALSPWRVRVPDSQAARLEMALRQFDSDLSVLPAKDANVITVSFAHRDGAMAARIVNDLLAGYAQRRERIYDDPQLEVVRRETETLSGAVENADAAIAAFKSRNDIADFTAERALLVRRRSDAAQGLADTNAAFAEQHARFTTLNRQIAAIPATVNLYRETDTDTRLQAIDGSLVELRARVATAQLQYRDDSRKMIDLHRLLRAREADRRTLAGNIAPSAIRNGRSPALDSLLLDRARAATEQAAAFVRGAALRGELGDIGRRLADLTGEEAALGELLRRKAVADAAFANASQVLAEQRMTEAEDALRLANVRVIQPGRIPLHPAPIPLLVVLAGTLLGAVATVAWCLTDFVLRPTLLTAEGLAHATGLPVLGVFPSEAGQNRLCTPV